MSKVMSQESDLQQKPLCGEPQCPGSNCQLCKAIRISVDEHAMIKCPHGVPSCCAGKPCDNCFDEKYPIHNQLQTRKGAVGGGSASDVVPRQDFVVSSSGPICQGCQKPEGSNPACEECVMLKTTEVPPFTRKYVEQLYWNMKSRFCPSQKGRIFKLVVLLSSLTIGSIDWTMHNCAFSTLVLMLSSSNEGMNSINQQTFAGYILAVIINHLQESGKCDPILLEVFRLELSIISGNFAWSNWSELVEFQDLYAVCVRYKIIIDEEVEYVFSNDNGSYNVAETLNGKSGSTLVGAYNWRPCINVLANGILSSDFNSRYRISAVILHRGGDHFSIIVFSQGIWLIDGKGKRTGEFKAESSIQELTIEQFQDLCASHGAFYFLDEIPFVYDTLFLGRQGLPPRKVFYGIKWYFLYDDGTMICENTGTVVKLQRTVFMTDDSRNHIRVFPALPPPPPQATCVSGPWVHPPPPPQAPCASGHWFTPPPPPAPSAQVAPAIQSKQQLSVNITMDDVKHYIDCSMMRRWSVSTCHPTNGHITLSGGYTESINQSNVSLYTFDSDDSNPKRLFKYDRHGQCNRFIDELNRQLNSSE